MYYWYNVIHIGKYTSIGTENVPQLGAVAYGFWLHTLITLLEHCGAHK